MQTDIERQGTRLHIDQLAHAGQQLVFGRQHIEIARQPALIAVARHAMRLGRSHHGLLHGRQLLLQRPLADGVVRHLLQGPVERAAVLGHGLVITGTRGTQLRAQTAAIEDRQADGWPHTGDAGAASGQHVQAQRQRR